MIKILHTGDIHLDSPFSGLSPRLAETRRNELRAAFTSMMTYAKMNSVDVMLIAGDVFDGEYATRETVALLTAEFEKFGKPVFVTPGNHDPATPDSVWRKYAFPDNVHVFLADQLKAVDLDELGVTVYGYAFVERDMTTAPPFAGYRVADPERINLLVCHADMTTKTSLSCPVTAEQILSFGADYTALGHIHNPPAAGRDNRYSYSGCLEPRAFDEIGPKGALIVEIEKSGKASEVSIKPVRLSKRRYERGEVAVDGASTQGEITEAVRKFIADNHYGEDTLLEVKLRGYVSPSLVIDADQMDGGSFGLCMLKIEDQTLPDIDTDALENDVTIKGEVYRQLERELQSGDERKREIARRALRYAFSALSGESI